MNRILSIVAAIAPLLCIFLIGHQIAGLIHTPSATAQSYRTELDSLAVQVTRAEKAAKIQFESESQTAVIESPFGSNQPEPVVTVQRPAEPVAVVDTFTREPLSVQGILKGAKPMAVLVDKSGATYIVKSGETLFNRKVVSIGNSGVILSDKSGNETLAIP